MISGPPYFPTTYRPPFRAGRCVGWGEPLLHFSGGDDNGLALQSQFGRSAKAASCSNSKKVTITSENCSLCWHVLIQPRGSGALTCATNLERAEHMIFYDVIDDGRGKYPEPLKIQAPLGTRTKVRQAADAEGVSSGEFVRRAIDLRVQQARELTSTQETVSTGGQSERTLACVFEVERAAD